MKKIQLNLTEVDKAYLAGFLDGDGSIITQIVKDDSRKFKFYIRISIAFFQKSDNHWFILKLSKLLKPYGYTRTREDMSEFVIVAKEPVNIILKELYPYLILKKTLCKLVLNIIDQLNRVETEADFLKVCKMVDETVNYTYSKKRIINYEFVNKYLNSPVETSNISPLPAPALGTPSFSLPPTGKQGKGEKQGEKKKY